MNLCSNKNKANGFLLSGKRVLQLENCFQKLAQYKNSYMTRNNFQFLLSLIIVMVGEMSVSAQTSFDEEVSAIVQRSEEKGLDAPIIFLGSSSIGNWRALDADFPDFSVLNHGFEGSTYRDLLAYQGQLVEPFEPSMLVIYSGENDIASGKEPSVVANDAELFVDGLRRTANGALVIVISVKPTPARWETKEKYMELNTKLKELAEGMDHMVFVDVWPQMLTRKGEPNAKLFLEDGLNMNEKGYAIWKNALLPYMSK
jgi:lysophospholipase L1-like esterase